MKDLMSKSHWEDRHRDHQAVRDCIAHEIARKNDSHDFEAITTVADELVSLLRMYTLPE